MIGLEQVLARVAPGWRLIDARPFGADEAGPSNDGTAKRAGYGRPLRLTLRDDAGREQMLVWHTVSADEFGHDRRSDRAQEILLAYDSFRLLPQHVAALDVGAICADGRLVSLRDAGELYLLTTYGGGVPYANDLRRIAVEGVVTDQDRDRCDVLAGYLAALHGEPLDRPALYRRAIRDLVGQGEGIYGIVDAYAAGDPVATPDRLRAIERRCADWRWRLRDQEHRLRRTHGDFHPFNLLFGGRAELTALDASRGAAGDPADDVTCLALNYAFFAADAPDRWRGALRSLWQQFWSAYGAAREDEQLLAVAPPFVAWRCLVMACPRFYPNLSAAGRDRMLSIAERALERGRLDLEDVERCLT